MACVHAHEHTFICTRISKLAIDTEKSVYLVRDSNAFACNFVSCVQLSAC